jgi:stage II sporulation protein D
MTFRPYVFNPRSTRIAYARHLSAGLLPALVALVLAAPALGATDLFIPGAGYGHGVGMSQYGAYGYALHGTDYRSILAHYYTGTALGDVDPNLVVTVLLATGGASSFTGATRVGGAKLRPASTYEVQALAGGRLRVTKQGGTAVGTFAAPLRAAGPTPLTVPGLGTYGGALEFRPTGSRRVETIDAVGLDDYVRGVVAAEMPSAWPMQALEAQAVAARTYAITTDAGGSAFDQYSDTRSQVYGGVGAETPRSDAAVAATRGQVVTYDGHPAATYFFSSSGGYTENNENVWPGSTPEPWLRGVPDPYDGAGHNPYHHWLIELTGARAASKLHSLLDGALVGIAVLGRGVSPRVTDAEVLGTGGTRAVTGTGLEQLLGLYSTWASFTTITTVARQHLSPSPTAPTASRSVASSPAGELAGAAEMAMPVPLVRAILAHLAPIPELAGTVYPGPRGAPIAVQEDRSGQWRTIRRARLGRGGAYAVQPPGHGKYRIVYRSFDGPSVTL